MDASAVIFVKPDSVLRYSSCSSTISRSTSSGLRPVHEVSMVMMGWSTLGISWIGMVKSAMRPNNTVRITPTLTLTGFWMAKRMMSMK